LLMAKQPSRPRTSGGTAVKARSEIYWHFIGANA